MDRVGCLLAGLVAIPVMRNHGRSIYLAVMLDKMGAMMVLPLLPYIATEQLDCKAATNVRRLPRGQPMPMNQA